ncbi:hypothetical protein BSL78_23655 [Apostichopus japonicus]|uniref:Uncharacterized protein n=1 Tax=Stichopus japonicus TaxID=307972 RepID=A0A2G8JUR3_STIJA|nr:hypothetical protein BSL78_23655 [Apostichopus japonicus]
MTVTHTERSYGVTVKPSTPLSNVTPFCRVTSLDHGEVSHHMHYEEQEGHPVEAGNDLYQEADNNDYEDDNVDDVDIFDDAELPDEPNPDNQLLYEGAPLSKGTDEDLCECCGQITTKAKNIKDGLFFVNISLSSQLKHLLETPSITAKLQPHEQEDEDDSIGDVMDGSVYKKLARDIFEVDDLSLTFHCDGISAFHSSNASVLPILCTINELPHKERKRHVLMAGFGLDLASLRCKLSCKAFLQNVTR